VVGRHVTVGVVDGAVGLSTLAASTKSCLAFKIQPGVVGVYAMELISPTPTEFHVPESRLHGIVVFVGAGGDAWEVRNGHISKLGKLGKN
jgi:hypothetical protein